MEIFGWVMKANIMIHVRWVVGGLLMRKILITVLSLKCEQSQEQRRSVVSTTPMIISKALTEETEPDVSSVSSVNVLHYSSLAQAASVPSARGAAHSDWHIQKVSPGWTDVRPPRVQSSRRNIGHSSSCWLTLMAFFGRCGYSYQSWHAKAVRLGTRCFMLIPPCWIQYCRPMYF